MLLWICNILRFFFKDSYFEEILGELKTDNCKLVDNRIILHNFVRFDGMYSINTLEIQLLEEYKCNPGLLLSSSAIDTKNIPFYYRYILYKKVLEIKKVLFMQAAKNKNFNYTARRKN